ncbi:eukaryotic translation initiation factor 2-alpha kinase 3-like isoform X2 [Xenia sp. Carnegie-2017]|uniref:eukaryotic translation initiation factor 2-alpha kinase 3-like isoform X2 n=1 Tax=Xenia sp. Carnegie-2017 TaxID=2897299 RepID=UPI001F04B5B8|nr:eukaryotic translation initiation factor 2-alpha kinase 3-like isoform X2 [Xenia sp. Carnegie-2017]
MFNIVHFVRISLLLISLTSLNVCKDSENFNEIHNSVMLSNELDRKTQLVIVGTIDGKLWGLDPTSDGMVKWSAVVSEKPLLLSTLSSVQMINEFTGFRLIPSLNGDLYQFSWDGIQMIPLNAESLLSSSIKINDGVGIVGGKNLWQTGIDPETGKVIYSCSDDGCSRYETESMQGILVLKRTQRTVRAVNERTGTERWNFSVGQHKLSFVDVNENVSHQPLDENVLLNMKRKIQVAIPEGIVTMVTRSKTGKQKTLWKQQLGRHEDQVYIHPSDDMKSVVRIELDKITLHNDYKAVARRTIWKPYLATSASRTPSIVGKTELAIRRPWDYPFDNGHYFFGKINSFDERKECLRNSTFNKDVDNQEFLFKFKSLISKWWREVVILLFTFVFFARQIFKYWRKKRILDLRIESESNEVLTLNFSCGNEDEFDERQNSCEIKNTVPSSSEKFISRYQQDFEHMACLGSGAFGLVFQAKNKIDDRQYAVKRIRLPSSPKARDKVMREVKVLASFEHPGIVRYYNSWCEQPSVEWLKEWDEKLRGDSKCPTMESISSFTCSSSDIQLKEMSFNDQLSDYERNIDISYSRRRHDTITVENEDDLITYGLGPNTEEIVDTSASFEISKHSAVNNNATKLSYESSGVVFESDSCQQYVQTYCSSSENDEVNDVDELETSGKHRFDLHLLYIQMQLCRRESLKDWLNMNVTNRNFYHSLDIFRQLIEAVDYIHQKGHIHRDLKPSNILFALDGSVKVGDFGLVTASNSSTVDENGYEDSKKYFNENLTGQVGTQLYASPEQETGTSYCFRADIFSLGVIFFELFYVFHTDMERLKTLSELRKRIIPETFLENMPLQSELTLWLLAKSPTDRPTAKEIFNSHIFIELLNNLSTMANTVYDREFVKLAQP